jgi:coenzyme F420-0:L-glutamate ligase/coenzyme F420-1:gamma-L-glutamate ligase
VAIGVAGIPALWDRRGEPDLYGYQLQHTDIGVADEIAAAAGLLMGQAAEGNPVVLVRGLNLPLTAGKATDLVRPKEMDLYR